MASVMATRDPEHPERDSGELGITVCGILLAADICCPASNHSAFHTRHELPSTFFRKRRRCVRPSHVEVRMQTPGCQFVAVSSTPTTENAGHASNSLAIVVKPSTRSRLVPAGFDTFFNCRFPISHQSLMGCQARLVG